MGALVVAGALAASVFGGWAAVELVLKAARTTGTGARPPEHVGGHVATDLSTVEPRVLRGGTWIGILERIAITGAILAGRPELVAAVVAVKGLGRWSDLQSNPALTERFIIGTLTSYIVAAACAFAAVWMLR
ncbi:MAG: hypothetical protein Q3979_02565 [Actinomycetaceae bacterium]|nr:hypothetical protein [Actinomycetaceae bacterium]